MLKIKCKYEHDDKNVKLVKLNTNIGPVVLNTHTLETIYQNKQNLSCNKNDQRQFDENLKKRFFNMCTFSRHDINMLMLLFQKGVYCYEYIDDWEKLREI